MSSPFHLKELDTCGCCPGEAEKEGHSNPPGQAALRYRAGIHPTFLRRMLERIHRWEVPSGETEGSRPLFQVLSTRATDDPAIALMDAWAVVADVLTFYQERIANEGFLRTATERRSILELARAIGYELDPGVAAEAWLAFKVDDAKGTPSRAVVAKGTQVQSIPAGEGERPQTFETKEEFTADVRWNAMRPRLARPQTLSMDTTHVYLAGTGLGLARGDVVLLVDNDDRRARRIRSVDEDRDAQRTTIAFEAELGQAQTGVDVDAETKLDPDQNPLALTRANISTWIFEKTWAETNLQAFLAHHQWGADDVLACLGELRSASLKGTGEVHALRETLAFFGHNAPLHASLPKETSANPVPISSFTGRRVDEVEDANSNGGPTAAWPVDWDDNVLSIWQDSLSLSGDYYAGPFDVYLERPIEDLGAGTWAVFEHPPDVFAPFIVNRAAEASRTGYGMSTKVAALELHDAEKNDSLGDNGSDKPDAFKFRTSVARVKSERLKLGTLPLPADVERGTLSLWIEPMVLGLRQGQRVALQGEDVDADGTVRHEILTLDAVTHTAGLTRLEFEPPGLVYGYKRGTMAINANVVLASHGETVGGEVLGGGDGSAIRQSFELKKPPLTYVALGSSSGSRSTLTVRVDGVEWKEASSLYFLGPHSKGYIVRLDDNAKARVIFGDGKRGARLPSGEENVIAEYRSGIGFEGEVGKGSLTLLKKRPYGIREVTNPLASAGADDPEILADARGNAPLTVLTLDRIVSLQDYEDFARAYPGIGKAQAVGVWNGESEVVHVTVADSRGHEVVPPLDGYLRDAINDARDPLRKVELASFQPLSFFVSAKVLIEEAHRWEDVKAAAETALLEAFSFEARAFGQPVAAAEVMQVMHGVKGVVAVDLDWLDRAAPPEAPPGASFNAVLDVQVARFDKDHSDGPRILPAQLLLIHPLGISLTEMAR